MLWGVVSLPGVSGNNYNPQQGSLHCHAELRPLYTSNSMICVSSSGDEQGIRNHRFTSNLSANFLPRVRHNSWGQGWTYFIEFKTNLIFCRVEYLRLFRTPIFLFGEKTILMENSYGRLLLLGLSACAVQCFTGHPWWPHDAAQGARGARGGRSAWGGLTPEQRRTPGGASIVGIL